MSLDVYTEKASDSDFYHPVSLRVVVTAHCVIVLHIYFILLGYKLSRMRTSLIHYFIP